MCVCVCVCVCVTVSLGRPYARSIYSIFPLCMESNVLEKFKNKIVSARFLYELLWFIGLSETVMLWNNFSKNLFDSKNFLNFSYL